MQRQMPMLFMLYIFYFCTLQNIYNSKRLCFRAFLSFKNSDYHTSKSFFVSKYKLIEYLFCLKFLKIQSFLLQRVFLYQRLSLFGVRESFYKKDSIFLTAESVFIKKTQSFLLPKVFLLKRLSLFYSRNCFYKKDSVFLVAESVFAKKIQSFSFWSTRSLQRLNLYRWRGFAIRAATIIKFPSLRGGKADEAIQRHKQQVCKSPIGDLGVMVTAIKARITNPRQRKRLNLSLLLINY